ncbi:DUF5134 domain-containing protein [Streptomyces sp. NPDC005438]|uniref:DUF5134 domain-containing protein n=1 Tax=Streptomyces sp. NPDC005438 TaxID=3156880 RepID=UPI0033A9A89A
MHHLPSGTAWLLTGLCAWTGVLCTLDHLRRRAAGHPRRDADGPGSPGAEACMAWAMALMALPSVGARVHPLVWVAIFAGWGLARLPGVARHGWEGLGHLAGALAMVYLGLAMSAPGSGTGHGGGLPWLTGALLLYYAAEVLLLGLRLAPVTAGAPVETSGPRSTGLPVACRICLGLAMIVMLASL